MSKSKKELKGSPKDFKDKKFSQRRERKGNGISYDNDISWYGKNAQLVADVASLPTLYPNGSRSGSSICRITGAFGAANLKNYSMPGIVSLEFSPFYGVSKSPNSALNMGLQSIYTMIRHANSGAKNYEAADLGQYLMLMDSIYSCIAEGIRAYGACFNYNVTDLYEPRALVYACGFDYDDLTSRQAEFRVRLNKAITKANAFAVPNVWNIMIRHVWLNSNIYKDNDEDNAQLYVFKQMNHNTWVDYEDGIIGPLNTYKKSNGYYSNIDVYFNRLETLISNVWMLEDAATLSGDILKAYGSNLLSFSNLSEDYVCEPVYNKEVLQQITNTVLYGYYNQDLDGSWNIYQDSNQADCLISKPNIFITGSNDAYNGDVTRELYASVRDQLNLYLHKDFANPAGIMIASRNIVMGDILTKVVDGVTYIGISPESIGSEIFFAARVYINLATSGKSVSTLDDLYVTGDEVYSLKGSVITDNLYLTSFTETNRSQSNSMDTHSPDSMVHLLVAAKFSYFPKIYWMYYWYDPKDDEFDVVLGDLHKIGRYAKLPFDVLVNIHDVAILSLLGTEKYGNTDTFHR